MWDVAPAEGKRRVDAQQTPGGLLRAPKQFRQVIDMVEDLARALEIELALGRQHHPARRSVDERHSGAALHLRQAAAAVKPNSRAAVLRLSDAASTEKKLRSAGSTVFGIASSLNLS
jgi:hypothetical protein